MVTFTKILLNWKAVQVNEPCKMCVSNILIAIKSRLHHTQKTVVQLKVQVKVQVKIQQI